MTILIQRVAEVVVSEGERFRPPRCFRMSNLGDLIFSNEWPQRDISESQYARFRKTADDDLESN